MGEQCNLKNPRRVLMSFHYRRDIARCRRVGARGIGKTRRFLVRLQLSWKGNKVEDRTVKSMMGFAMGSTCFFQAPLHVSRFPFSSIPCSSCSSQSNSLTSRNAAARQKIGVPAAVERNNYLNDDGLCKRRAILFLGISVFPILQLKAQALESSAQGKLVPLLVLFAMWLFWNLTRRVSI